MPWALAREAWRSNAARWEALDSKPGSGQEASRSALRSDQSYGRKAEGRNPSIAGPVCQPSPRSIIKSLLKLQLTICRRKNNPNPSRHLRADQSQSHGILQRMEGQCDSSVEGKFNECQSSGPGKYLEWSGLRRRWQAEPRWVPRLLPKDKVDERVLRRVDRVRPHWSELCHVQLCQSRWRLHTGWYVRNFSFFMCQIARIHGRRQSTMICSREGS